MRFSPSAALWALAGSTAAAPTTGASTLLSKRQFSTVPHDSIAFIPESYRGGAEGNAIKRFEPYLHIAHGCASYPAVSASGQVGGGLQNSGGPSSGCNDGRNGQTYVRGAFHNGRYAIMYAWYFPKDQISAGGANGGHRHDWESIVVWIDDRKSRSSVHSLQTSLADIFFLSRSCQRQPSRLRRRGIRPRRLQNDDFAQHGRRLLALAG